MLSRSLISVALAALAAAQSSVLTFTSVPNPVTDGQPQAITYATNDTMTPVTITLRKGLSTNLETLYDITTEASGGSFVWTPRTDLPNGADYALQITQANQTNYYGPFRVQGYVGPLSSSASGSATATDSAASTGFVTGAPASSSGTGMPMSRNTTFVSASLSSSTSVAAVTTSTMASSTKTSAAATSATSGVANAKAQIGSSLALVGAIAALLV